MPTIRESIDPKAMHQGEWGQMVRKKLGISKDPEAVDAPPPPIIEDTEARQQDTADMLRKRKGRAAAMLTGGNAGAPQTASRTLLGG